MDAQNEKSGKSKRHPVLGRVVVDAPFLDLVLDDRCGPYRRIVWILLGPGGMAEHHDKVLSGVHPYERILVVREHLEELFPALHHGLLGSVDLSFTIDERMILSHQFRKTFEVLAVDTIVELQCNGLWIS